MQSSKEGGSHWVGDSFIKAFVTLPVVISTQTHTEAQTARQGILVQRKCDVSWPQYKQRPTSVKYIHVHTLTHTHPWGTWQSLSFKLETAWYRKRLITISTLRHTDTFTCTHWHMHNTHAAFKDTYRDRQVFPITKQSFEMLHGIFLQGLSTYRLTVLKKEETETLKTEETSRQCHKLNLNLSNKWVLNYYCVCIAVDIKWEQCENLF